MKSVINILLKSVAIILALYLSTITLSKNVIQTELPYLHNKCTSGLIYSGYKGLPIPYAYEDIDNGVYKDDVLIFTIDYWLWVFLFLIPIMYIRKVKRNKYKINFKELLNNNIFYLTFSFLLYIFYWYVYNMTMSATVFC